MFNGYCFDIEANGLYFEATKIWTISLRDLDNPEIKLKLNPFKDPEAINKFKEWHNKYDNPMVVGHYILGYDCFVIFKLLGINFTVGKDTMFDKPCRFIDTLYLSQYLNPDLNGHSLEDWGERVSKEKIDYLKAAKEAGIVPEDAKKGDEFLVYGGDLMDEYCERDTEVNVMAFRKMWDVFSKYYSCTPDDLPSHFKCGQKSFYLMSCQEFTGWKFDKKYGEEVQEIIRGMMKELEDDVLPQLPPRALKKGEEKDYRMPAKPFKKDGSYSSHMLNFIEKHKGIQKDGESVINFYGKDYEVVGGTLLDVSVPMEIKDGDELKEWFKSQNWIPTMYNFKRGADGKPERDLNGKLIPTSPKIQEAGKICPNLLALDGDLPKKIVKFLSLRNRLSVLTSWIENPRLAMDGRLSPRRTGIAATHRQKHAEVVNVPKASDKVLLGKEFRSLFIAEDGFKIAAGDAAALEGRVQGHYCVPMETQALTRRGWKKYEDLVVGEDILAYNPDTKMKEWTPLLEKCKFSDAETFNISNKHFKVRATANHRWFVSYRNTSTGKYEDRVIETKDLNTACNLIVNAPMADFAADPKCRGVFDGKYGVDWVGRTISKGLHGIESFMEGFPIADGNYNNQNAYKGGNSKEIGKGRWKFSQNLGEHYEAALTSAYICHSGYLNIEYRDNPNSRMATVTLNKRGFVGMQNMRITRHGIEDVWCPRTKFGSWVMRQGDVITITGNTWRYDNGVTAKEILEGDPHSKNVMAFFDHIPEVRQFDINAPDFDKEHPVFKPYRDRSKGGYYSILYGAGGPKVASTLGIPEKMGKEKLDKFWSVNLGTKKLKDNLEKFWETKGEKKWLPAIDGRRLITRKKSALLNTIFQSCGGIAMDYACCFMDAWLGGIKFDKDFKPHYIYKGYIVRRIGYFHDEMEFECEEPIAEEIAKMIEKSITKAGEYLKLNVPLAGEGKVGINWKEVH